MGEESVAVQAVQAVRIWVSDLFPNVAGCVDDITVIRSMSRAFHFTRAQIC
jgi:hypothetical protein